MNINRGEKMNKIVVGIMILLFSTIAFSKQDENSYKIYYENFKLVNNKTNTNVQIKYPQLEGIKSLEKQKKINKLIREKAIFTLYSEDKEVKDGLNLEVRAEVKYFSKNLISIKYSAKSHYQDTMRVYEIIYSTNIDIENAGLLNYKLLFNNNFRKILNRKLFKYSSLDKAKKEEKMDRNSYEYGYTYGNDEIIKELFDKYYNEFGENRYYFDKTKFTLVAEIPDGSGRNIELSAEYKDIKNAINSKYKIWNEFY